MSRITRTWQTVRLALAMAKTNRLWDEKGGNHPDTKAAALAYHQLGTRYGRKASERGYR